MYELYGVTKEEITIVEARALVKSPMRTLCRSQIQHSFVTEHVRGNRNPLEPFYLLQHLGQAQIGVAWLPRLIEALAAIKIQGENPIEVSGGSVRELAPTWRPTENPCASPGLPLA